jgi:PIN domain nuclease of toxin-antitoxin system
LPVDEECVSRLEKLPPLHHDPFDRLLICQALQHELILVTVDPAVRTYPVPIL